MAPMDGPSWTVLLIILCHIECHKLKVSPRSHLYWIKFMSKIKRLSKKDIASRPLKIFHDVPDVRFVEVFTLAYVRKGDGFMLSYSISLESTAGTSFLVRSRLECLTTCWTNTNCTTVIFTTKNSGCQMMFPLVVELPWTSIGHYGPVWNELMNRLGLAMC